MSRLAVVCCTVAVLLFGLSIAGCGGGGEKPVPVSGRVTVDGQPVANVAVHFMALGKNHVGTGKTGPDGTFTLENGALPGVNKVYFAVVREMPQGVDETALAAGAAELPPVESPIPPKYTDPLNPQLEFTVPAGGTKEANFDLKKE